MHDPCACSPSLVWDDTEQAYYYFFLSCNGKTKKDIWLTKPIGNMATINCKKRGEEEEGEK
jgi:hypothetical protein